MKKVKEFLYKLRKVKDKGAYFVHSHEEVNFTSYQDLFRQGLWMKNYLYEKGIRSKDEVIISVDTSEWFYITILACMLGDFIAVPLSVNSDDLSKLKSVLEVCHHAVLVTDKEALCQEVSPLGLGLGNYICWNNEMIEGLDSVLQETWTEIEDLVLSDEESGLDIAYIQFSSGSTSSPKGVGITNQGIILNVDSIIESRNMYGEEVFVTWVPSYHNFGLFFNIFLPIRYGYDAHIIDTQYVIKDPVFYFDYCSKVKGTVASGTNFYLNFIVKLLQEQGTQKEWDFSSVHTFLIGTEPLSINLCNEFAKYMKKSKFKHLALCPAYGLTEGTLIVSAVTNDDYTKKVSVNKESMSIGQALEIVDDDHPLASDIISVGRIF